MIGTLCDPNWGIQAGDSEDHQPLGIQVHLIQIKAEEAPQHICCNYKPNVAI